MEMKSKEKQKQKKMVQFTEDLKEMVERIKSEDVNNKVQNSKDAAENAAAISEEEVEEEQLVMFIMLMQNMQSL